MNEDIGTTGGVVADLTGFATIVTDEGAATALCEDRWPSPPGCKWIASPVAHGVWEAWHVMEDGFPFPNHRVFVGPDSGITLFSARPDVHSDEAIGEALRRRYQLGVHMTAGETARLATEITLDSRGL